jgi:hypothetical protein
MNLNSLTLQQGAAAGGLIVLLQLVAYLMGVEMLLSPWLGAGRFIVVVAAMLMACVAVRKDEGSLSYGRAVWESWVAGALASLLGVLFMIVMVTFDSQLASNLLDATMIQMKASLGGFAKSMGGDMMKQVEDQTKWMLQPTGQLLAWAIGLVMWLMIAAIVGAIGKRPNPQSIR